jgi:hypothetical protein
MNMVDVKKPITNPDFVSAMNQLRTAQNPDHEATFFEELRKAHFLAPVAIAPTPEHGDETGKVVLKEGTTIGFQMISDSANRSFFPVFTDWEELRKWRDTPGQQTLIVTFDDLSAMILEGSGNSGGLVINPYGQNILLDNERVAVLKGRSVSQLYTVEQETKVLLGEPKEYPQALAEAVKRYLKTVREVKKAHLMLMVKDKEQSFLIVVDFSGDRKKVFDGIATAASPHLKPGQLIDMVLASDRFGQDAIRDKNPFYTRGGFGF